MKVYIFIGIFIILFVTNVNSENCEFGGWQIPNISPEGTIFLNGSWWSVQEYPIENGMMRKLDRLNFEPPENGEILPIEQAIAIATQFLEDNRDALGIPENVQIVIEQSTNYPLSLTLFNFDQQYCNGVPVMDTFAGILMVGEQGVYSLGFMWFPSFSIESTIPEISAEEASEIAEDNKNKPKLKIMPTKDKDFKLIWDVNGKYVDAIDGKIINNDGGENRGLNKNIYKWIIFIIIISLTIFIGLYIKR